MSPQDEARLLAAGHEAGVAVERQRCAKLVCAGCRKDYPVHKHEPHLGTFHTTPEAALKALTNMKDYIKDCCYCLCEARRLGILEPGK